MIKIPDHLLENARRIPCTDNMILAIDAGLKTVTRRPVKYTASGSLAKCLYGEPGDLLLVTGAHIFVDKHGQVATERKDRDRVIYRVDWDGEPAVEDDAWRPPMFFPKWAPTRVLRNIGTAVVKLCDISPPEALAEGIRKHRIGVGGSAEVLYHWREESREFFKTPVDAFVDLWNNIHEERGLLFSSNPEVLSPDKPVGLDKTEDILFEYGIGLFA